MYGIERTASLIIALAQVDEDVARQDLIKILSRKDTAYKALKDLYEQSKIQLSKFEKRCGELEETNEDLATELRRLS